MSVIGTKRTSERAQTMSAFGGKADIMTLQNLKGVSVKGVPWRGEPALRSQQQMQYA
jgi:hypothetical protein